MREGGRERGTDEARQGARYKSRKLWDEEAMEGATERGSEGTKEQ